ncbi:MAG: RnfABCDGE type electron transport complex subunit G [Faecalibacterium sp.]|nr:RnfABCDGE type electron transport complex subunit G [Ruminococcus sp.]MCM1392327.1 RnfABCDGE type electron transport complex subunit G [Ruminococcus sp.]MCM1486048.1 RnfABCDGE type electron transport complex subunit G [Faecalibacterium sp.]
MKKIKAKDIIVPAAALLVICFVAAILLALTNNVTKGKIAQNAVDTENASRQLVLSAATDFSKAETYADTEITYCKGTDASGNLVGYIFTSAAKGYGGDVKVMVGFDTNGEIIGFEILDCSNETPGLGQNSKKLEFKERFIGKSGELTVNKNSNEGQNVQAITAATITSTAVVNAVNLAVNAFNEIAGGVSNG